MKIVLTGATGFVGGEVLAQLLDHPTVRGVTCLTRSPIARSHPKLTALVHKDFAAYDDDVITRLADHHACIWALGGKASDFTLAFARAMAARVHPFSFCYLSGMGAEKDLAALASAEGDFAAYAFRPARILPKKAGQLSQWLLAPLVVRVDTLAKAMIHVAIHGSAETTIGNRAIKALAGR